MCRIHRGFFFREQNGTEEWLNDPYTWYTCMFFTRWFTTFGFISDGFPFNIHIEDFLFSLRFIVMEPLLIRGDDLLKNNLPFIFEPLQKRQRGIDYLFCHRLKAVMASSGHIHVISPFLNFLLIICLLLIILCQIARNLFLPSNARHIRFIPEPLTFIPP